MRGATDRCEGDDVANSNFGFVKGGCDVEGGGAQEFGVADGAVVVGVVVDGEAKGSAAIGGGGVDNVTVVGADVAHVASCIVCSDGSSECFACFRDEVGGEDVDGVGAVGCYGACGGVTVDGDGDGVAGREFASHGACDGCFGLASFNAVDDVVGCDNVDADGGGAVAWGNGVNEVGVCGAHGACVAHGVVGNDAGSDGFACVGNEVGSGNVDAVVAAGIDLACEGFAVDGEGDDVTGYEFAGDFACDRDADQACFSGVECVVGGDNVDAECGGGAAWACGIDQVGACGAEVGAVARGVVGKDGSVNFEVRVGAQVRGGDVDAVVAINVNAAGKGFAVDGEGDDVARGEFARDFAGDG